MLPRQILPSLLCALFIVTACTPITPVAPPTATATSTRTPWASQTPVATAARILHTPTITPSPTQFPHEHLSGGLIFEEYELKDTSPFDKLTFEPLVGTRKEILKRYDTRLYMDKEYDNFIPDPLIEATYPSRTLMWKGKELRARMISLENGDSIRVTLDGQDYFSLQRDPSDVIFLKGFWTYGDHWIMEIVKVDKSKPKREFMDYTYGDIIWDGVSLNQKYGYEESFDLQTMNGRIFYFYKKNNEYGISYDNQTVSLGYSYILHYHFCCDNGDRLNPGRAEIKTAVFYIVTFLAERDGKKYYSVIWLP